MMPPGTSNLKNIKTQPSAPGPNPTMNTTLEFQLPLPTDSLFCPKMQCFVYDNIFAGWTQPLIGVFTLPIGDLMDSLYYEQEKELNAISEICEELKAIASGEKQVVPDLGQSKHDIAALVAGKHVADAGGNINDAEVYSDEEGLFTTQPGDAPNYSLNDSDRKSMEKAKKKQAKAFKGAENESDLKESFGVNEDVEEQIEEARASDNLNRIKTAKSLLLNQVANAELNQQYGDNNADGKIERDASGMQATSGLAMVQKGKKAAYA